MFRRVFPRQFDNSYEGYKFAIAILFFVVLARLAGFVSAVGGNPWASTRFMLQRGDGVPLDSFPTNAADTVMLLFRMAMLHYLLLGLLGLVALIRYRAMIPMMFVLLLIDEITRKAIVLTFPVTRAGVSAGSGVNLAFLMVILIGLALALGTPRSSERNSG